MEDNLSQQDRHKVVDGLASKIVGRILADDVLYTLIPAIMQINGGQYEDVQRFVDTANAGLERIGSRYRFKATPREREAASDEFDYVDT